MSAKSKSKASGKRKTYVKATSSSSTTPRVDTYELLDEEGLKRYMHDRNMIYDGDDFDIKQARAICKDTRLVSNSPCRDVRESNVSLVFRRILNLMKTSNGARKTLVTKNAVGYYVKLVHKTPSAQRENFM
jgi:hypothetical protein